MTMQNIPTLWEGEVRCGPTLGKGNSCEVSSVRWVTLLSDDHDDDDNDDENNHNMNGRKRLGRLYAKPPPGSTQYSNNNNNASNNQRPPRLALKRILSQDEHRFSSSYDFETAQEDLQRELDILREIQHPHIIELHAVGKSKKASKNNKNNNNGNPQTTFLVLTRMHATLENLISKWRNQQGLGLYAWIVGDIESGKQLWLERMLLLSQVAQAVRCLHDHRIIYRDIKPENVGMDDNRMPKLYDFGLAKRLPPAKNENDDIPFRMTGMTGTLRYMAPEVILSDKYHLSADIYSFAILMYHVLSLHIPYADVPPSQFEEFVVVKETRPPIDPSWPPKLQSCMADMWHSNPPKRPNSTQLMTILEDMLRGSEDELYPSCQGGNVNEPNSSWGSMLWQNSFGS